MTHSRYLKLIQQLKQWLYEYHTLDRPSVTDSVYDSLLAQVKTYEGGSS